MANRSNLWLFLTLAIVALTADQVGKYVAFRSMYDGKAWASYDLVPGVFQLYVDYMPEKEMCNCWFAKANGPVAPKVNHGALYGLGSDQTRLANGFFATISFLAAIAVAWWGTRPSTRRDRVLSSALGLILGGTIGNFYDRIVFGGVRDFLHWYYFRFPVFNIADSCLVCGAGLLLFHAMFLHQEEKKEETIATVAGSVAPATHEEKAT
jgi:lipoprotein signal peptidase